MEDTITTSSSILGLRQQLFDTVAEQNQVDSVVLENYKDQVSQLRTTFKVHEEKNNQNLREAAQKIIQLESDMAVVSSASMLASSALEDRVHFYQSSLVEVDAQYESLRSISGTTIAEMKTTASEKVNKALAAANEAKEKYTAGLLDIKQEARRRNRDAAHELRATETDLKEQYYRRTRDVSLQRIRNLHEMERETVGSSTKTAYPFVATPSATTGMESDTNNIGGSNIRSGGIIISSGNISSSSSSSRPDFSLSRLAKVAESHDNARAREEIFDLSSKFQNGVEVQKQLQKEIQRLQDELMTAAHGLRKLETIRRDLETERDITQQLRNRVETLEDEHRSTEALRSSLAAEQRKTNALENAVQHAEARAVVEHGKGYDKGLSKMENEVQLLQEQVTGNRDRMAQEYEKVVASLRGQRDDFEAKLRAMEKRDATQRGGNNIRTSTELARALESADGLVGEVREQSLWVVEKKDLERRLEDYKRRQRELLTEKDILISKENTLDEAKRRAEEHWQRQMETKEKELKSGKEKEELLAQQLSDLKEQQRQQQQQQQYAAIPTTSPPQVQIQHRQHHQQQHQHQHQQPMSTTTFSLSPPRPPSQQHQHLNDLRLALVATRRELDDLHASMNDAKQHISDLTWQNTSLRHDAFMTRSSSALRTTADTHPHLASPVSPARSRSGPSSLNEYHANTRTLSRVLSNTKPLRLRLDRSTEAHRRRSLRNTFLANSVDGGFARSSLSNSRRREDAGIRTTIRTPVEERELYRSDLSSRGVGVHSATTSIVPPESPSFDQDIDDLLLSQQLNPLGYHKPFLEGPI
jgi:hypothetical protein